jgi:hypothetical protein
VGGMMLRREEEGKNDSTDQKALHYKKLLGVRLSIDRMNWLIFDPNAKMRIKDLQTFAHQNEKWQPQ